MEIAIIFLCIWWIIYKIFYSPKARIRALWKEIYRIPIKTARAKRKLPEKAEFFDEICEKALKIRYEMINALLNYYFDPNEDKEYIRENNNRIPYNYRQL